MKVYTRKILIIGGGRVGLSALHYCKNNNFAAIVIDENKDCLVSSKVDIIQTDNYFKIIKDIEEKQSVLMVMKLNELISIVDTFVFDYIIPAIPIHVLGQLTIDFFLNKNVQINPSVTLIEKIHQKLDPNVICNYNASQGIIVASFMPSGNKCAPNCIEHLTCPITRIEKPKPLYEVFKDSSQGFYSFFMISEQLKPNLGGFSSDSIRDFLKMLYSVKDQFIIGTACMCHGIINAFEIKKE